MLFGHVLLHVALSGESFATSWPSAGELFVCVVGYVALSVTIAILAQDLYKKSVYLDLRKSYSCETKQIFLLFARTFSYRS